MKRFQNLHRSSHSGLGLIYIFLIPVSDSAKQPFCFCIARVGVEVTYVPKSTRAKIQEPKPSFIWNPFLNYVLVMCAAAWARSRHVRNSARSIIRNPLVQAQEVVLPPRPGGRMQLLWPKTMLKQSLAPVVLSLHSPILSAFTLDAGNSLVHEFYVAHAVEVQFWPLNGGEDCWC